MGSCIKRSATPSERQNLLEPARPPTLTSSISATTTTTSTIQNNKMIHKSTSMRSIMIGVLLFSMVSCIMAEEQVHQRKLMQLQQPWLRIPVYDTINPFQVIGALGVTLTDNISYG